MFALIKRWTCKHEFTHLRNIYGDEINAAGGMRSWWKCKRCGKYELRPYLHQ